MEVYFEFLGLGGNFLWVRGGVSRVGLRYILGG